jgi:hypothetical protein
MIWHEDGGRKLEDGLQIQEGAASVPSSILNPPFSLRRVSSRQAG